MLRRARALIAASDGADLRWASASLVPRPVSAVIGDGRPSCRPTKPLAPGRQFPPHSLIGEVPNAHTNVSSVG